MSSIKCKGLISYPLGPNNRNILLQLLLYLYLSMMRRTTNILSKEIEFMYPGINKSRPIESFPKYVYTIKNYTSNLKKL